MPDLDKTHETPRASVADDLEVSGRFRRPGEGPAAEASDLDSRLAPPTGTTVQGWHSNPEISRGLTYGSGAGVKDASLPSPARATGAGSWFSTREFVAGMKRTPRDAAGAAELLFWEILDAATLPPGYTWGEVTPDGTGPAVVAASQVDASVIRVEFSAVLRTHPYKGAVLNPWSYKVEEVATARRLTVVRCVRASDTEVDLITEELATLPTNYRVTVKDVQDAAGDPVGAGGGATSVTFTSTGAPWETFGDAHFYYGILTGLNSDTASDIEPDITGPDLVAVNPVAGAGFADVDTNVLNQVVDPETGVNQSSVELDIWRGPGEPVEPVWRGSGGGAQPGYAVTETPVAGGFEYDIDPAVDFPDGVVITVYGRATNLADLPVGMNKSYWFKTFDKFGFIVATQTADYELSLVFSSAMKTTGPEGVLLEDPATYALESYGIGLPAGVFYPSAVNVISPTLVRLTLPLTTRDALYKMTVVQDIRLLTGDSAQGAISDWTGAVSLPRVGTVLPTGPRTLEVYFNRELRDNPDLVNPSAYTFTGGLRAEAVERVDGLTVRLTLNRPMERRKTYVLSVKANP